ncbi:MAG: caspase family protein [Arenicellales bacterium]
MVDTLINKWRVGIRYGLLSTAIAAALPGQGIAALPDYMDLNRAIINCRQGVFDARIGEEDSFIACSQLYESDHKQVWVYRKYAELLHGRSRLEEAATVVTKGLALFPNDSALKSLQKTVRDAISEAEWFAKKKIIDSSSSSASENKTMADCEVLLGIPGMKLPEECISELTDQSISDKELESAEVKVKINDQEVVDKPAEPAPPEIIEEEGAHRGAVDVASELKDQSISFGEYHALVIGNNKYSHFTDLKTAVNDAKSVSDLLKNRYGFKVTPLINASRSKIISALSKLRKNLRPTDNLLIYYAGHGSIDNITNRGYWLPVDAEIDNPANWIANDDITTQLKAMRAKHVLVVADSCYSASLTRNVDLDLRTGGQAEWIKRMVTRRSRTVLTSGGLEPVADSGQNNHSVFANAFIEELSTNQDIIDMDALAKSIKRRVVLRARQTPVYSDILYTDHDDGDFIFNPE